MNLTLRDLRSSLESLKLWVGEFADITESRGTVIGMSLLRDGITQLVACFDGQGSKYPLVVEAVYPNVPGIAESFRFLRGLRMSYTAHRFGAYRQCVIGLAIDARGEFLRLQGGSADYRGPSAGRPREDLIRVAEMAVGYAAARVSELEGQLVAAASAMTAEQRLALKPLPMVIPGHDGTGVRESRGSIRKKAQPPPAERSG